MEITFVQHKHNVHFVQQSYFSENCLLTGRSRIKIWAIYTLTGSSNGTLKSDSFMALSWMILSKNKVLSFVTSKPLQMDNVPNRSGSTFSFCSHFFLSLGSLCFQLVFDTLKLPGCSLGGLHWSLPTHRVRSQLCQCLKVFLQWYMEGFLFKDGYGDTDSKSGCTVEI